MREHEPVESLADLAQVLSRLVELEEPRGTIASVEMAFGPERQLRRPGSRVDEQIPAGIGRHARHFTDVDIVGKPFQRVSSRHREFQ